MLRGILIAGALVASPFVLYMFARVVSYAVFKSYFEIKFEIEKEETERGSLTKFH